MGCMTNSKDKYYTEMCNTLTNYNDCNNTPLSNANILEALCKVMEEESIMDANNVTTNTFSHASNAQRENANAIFKSEKLDKSDDLVYALNNLTIDDAKYYELKTETTSEAQGDLTRNLVIVTHTSNGNFEQTLLNCQTIPVLPLPKTPGIDQGIGEIKLTP